MMLAVPPVRIYTYSMIIENDKVEHFVVSYGEMSAAYNERLMEFDYKEELDRIWNDEWFESDKFTWDDLEEMAIIFEGDFKCPENEYRFLEVNAIREWLIGKKKSL
tara:strand:- start:119 stop:436 length:318 start_codon:yes stop_codon:yes gene_type:complete